MIEIKVPDKCSECEHAELVAPFTDYPVCRMQRMDFKNQQQDISTCAINLNSRPDWCPMVNLEKEYEKLSDEKKEALEKFIESVNILFGWNRNEGEERV